MKFISRLPCAVACLSVALDICKDIERGWYIWILIAVWVALAIQVAVRGVE